jgi:ribokinase
MVFGAFGPDGDRRLYSFRGANLALGPQDLPNSALAGSRRLHLNGPEYNLAFDLLVRSRKLDVPNSLDPGSILIHEHPAEMPLLLANTDVLFVNHVEFAELGGGQSDAENAANLLGQGVGWVVMKSGEHGCTVFRAGHAPLRAPAFDIQAVDSTGAGDAFNAAFLYALLRGDTLPQVLRFANAVGALVALAVGATSGAPKGVDAVERFMRETNVKDEG